MRRSSSLMAVFAVAATLNGCRKVPAPRQGPPADPVLARVGQTSITRSEFLNYWYSLPLASRTSHPNPEERLRLVQGYADQQALPVLARKAGLQGTPEYRAMVKDYEDGVLSRMYLERLRAEIVISSADARQYYDAHREQFVVDGVAHWSHIVTKSRETARKAQELLNAGKPFEEVAGSLSIDRATARNGGRMPPLPLRQLDSFLANTLLALRKGQIFGPQQTAAGFEIIRKDKEIEGVLQSFDDAAPQVQAILQGPRLFARLASERKNLPIVVDETQVQSTDLPTQ